MCNEVKTDLTNSELKVLYFIDEYTSVSPKTLILKLGINKSNLALLTKQLSDKKLIDIRRSPSDKRNKVIVLTSFGKHALEKYFDELSKFFHDDQEDIEPLLQKLLEYLNKKI